MKIAIVGATGLVGQMFLKVLEEEGIAADYYLFASAKSSGKKISFMGAEQKIIELTPVNIKKARPDFALFSAGSEISKQFAPLFTALGCIVIDNSSAFRRDADVPLVVLECNPEDVNPTPSAAQRRPPLPAKGIIIANPNCSTIGAVVALKPLEDLYKIKRIVYSTYQAVSGAGQAGVDDYRLGMNASVSGKLTTPKKFQHQIISNVIPHIDSFLPNGNTKEEEKMIFETRKILHRPDLAVSATTVRVPVENCHSISINVEFYRKPNLEEIKNALAKAPGVVLCDNPQNNEYPMPILANGRNEVFVGRIRFDESCENCVNLFTVSDNIRKGAATNAVQILELLGGSKLTSPTIQKPSDKSFQKI